MSVLDEDEMEDWTPKAMQFSSAVFSRLCLLPEHQEPECPDGPSDKGIACMSTPLDSSSVRVGNVDASG